ncbi:adenosylcobinamide-GDP ribazoletransferase, partial [Streptomyces shenzhenensis]
PAARPEGLGAAVAGVVPTGGAVAVGGVVVGAAGVLGALFGAYDMVRTVLAVVVGVGVAELLLRRCVRRFGGVTGDVFGALAETAATAGLVVLALGAPLGGP